MRIPLATKLGLSLGILSVLTLASPAIANEGSPSEENIQPTAAPAVDEGASERDGESSGFERPKLSLGGEMGLATGSGRMHEVAPTWGAHAGAYVLPFLVTGLAFTRASPNGNEGEWMDATAVTLRASFHPFPDFFIDPWIAVDAGYSHIEAGYSYGKADPELENDGLVGGLGFGVDVVIADVIAIGPDARAFSDGTWSWRGLGVHAEARF